MRSLATVVRGAASAGAAPGADRHRRRGRRRPAARLLKTGQRLVSREGALWRWDGLTASADAPTAAAQRLAQKNRLAELDAEMVAATQKVRTAEAALAAAESTVRERVAGEAAARQAWRDGQRAVGEARDALARAEKAAGELSGRRDALSTKRARASTTISCEATAAFGDAEAQLAGSARSRRSARPARSACRHVTRDRGVLADARALHEGLKREAEARVRRLDAIAADRGDLDAAGGERRNADRFARRAPRRDRVRTAKRWPMRPTRSTPGGARC